MSEKPSVEQILRKMEQQLGAEPLPMKLLSQLSPETVYDHVAMRQHVDTRPNIPAKEKMLMFVATAAALGSEFCTRTYARLALKAGASAEEITEALVVARFVKASTVWATAVPAMELLVAAKKEAASAE